MTKKGVIPADEDIVLVKDYIEDIKVDLKYSTADNFTGKIIYNFSDAYLRYGTVKRLQKAQEILRAKGLSLKIWDAFRPAAAQFVMWEVYPDDDFVADPTTGFSTHSRGNTVDVTVVDKDENEIAMPTKFDDFEEMIKYDYNSAENSETSKNAIMLKEIMVNEGFHPCTTEWWHFRDIDVYPVEKEFSPANLTN